MVTRDPQDWLRVTRDPQDWLREQGFAPKKSSDLGPQFLLFFLIVIVAVVLMVRGCIEDDRTNSTWRSYVATHHCSYLYSETRTAGYVEWIPISKTFDCFRCDDNPLACHERHERN